MKKALRTQYAESMTDKKSAKSIVGIDHCLTEIGRVRSDPDPKVHVAAAQRCVDKLTTLGIVVPAHFAAALNLMRRAPATSAASRPST